MNDQISRQKLIKELNSYHYTAIGMRCGKKMTAEIIKGYHDHVIEVIEHQTPADQWIPCSERLPEEWQKVLVTLEAFKGVRIVRTDQIVDGNWWQWNSDNVTAWMPLPEPYKGLENK